MAWNASTDFKFDPGASSGWGGNFDDAYKTDWNKDFTKDSSSGSNKGLNFLKGFAKNLFGGQDQSSPYSFGKGSAGAGFSQFTPDIGIITQGGGPGQFIPGQPGWGEKLAGAALGAIPAFF